MEAELSEAKSIFNSQFSMSSKINSSFLIRNERRKQSRGEWNGKNYEKIEFLTPNGEARAWVGGRNKINCAFLYITVRIRMDFLLFPILYVDLRVLWELLSKHCAMKKKCWERKRFNFFLSFWQFLSCDWICWEKIRSLQSRLQVMWQKCIVTRHSLI